MARRTAETFTPFDAADYLRDERTAAEYLLAALEDPNPAVLLAALGDIARSRGMTKIAQVTALARDGLAKAVTSQDARHRKTGLDRSDIAGPARLAPVHPGRILAEEFLTPFGLSAKRLATALGVPPNRISLIVAGKRALTADTALRLARYFGTTPEFWLNLQSAFDLGLARRDAGAEIAASVTPRAA